jgi:protein phosphatase
MEYRAFSLKGSFRDQNEDAYAVGRNGVFVVADGVGGGKYGEVASRIAARTIPIYLASNMHSLMRKPRSTMIRAVREANEAIIRHGLMDPRFVGMGTTVVVAFLDGKKAHIVNVGDSRGYIIRPPATIRQLTKDHSLLQELKITQNQQSSINSQLLKHVVTQWLGSREVSPYYSTVSLRRSDFFLLCTDGLTNALSETSIMHLVLSGSILQQISRELSLAVTDRSATDDVTIILVYLDQDNRKSKKH